MSINDIPDDLILVLALNLSLPDIIPFCQAHSRFKKLVCDNEYFWKQRFIQDYDQGSCHGSNYVRSQDYGPMIESWKHLYHLGCLNVLIFGTIYVPETDKQLKLKSRSKRQTKDSYMGLDFRAKRISACSSLNAAMISYIDFNDNVWVFGKGERGRLGLGPNILSVDIATKIPNIKAREIVLGINHSVIIDLDHNIWTFGDNKFGQLGYDNHSIVQYTPKKIPNLKGKSASVGAYHTIVIDLDNNVWSFGFNVEGQLGYRGEVSSPTQISDLKAKCVAAGYNDTIIIDLNNDVWRCGANTWIKLKDNPWVPSKIPNLKGKFVTANSSSIFVIDLDDNVWALGSNHYGELGLGDNIYRDVFTCIPNLKAKYVSNSNFNMAMIDLDNNLWICGKNIINHSKKHIMSPVQIPNVKVYQISVGSGYVLATTM